MRAGDLRHRMTMTAPVGVFPASDTLPIDIETSIPMKITVLPPALESLNLGGFQTQTFYRLGCRYRTDIKPSFVLKEECCTQRAFQILSVVPSERQDDVEMTCVTSG